MRKQHTAAMRAAFPPTIPIMAGFLILGAGFGILMRSIGLGALWTFLMSLFVYAGSMQYVAITLLTAAVHPLYAFAVTLMVNARHLFYGISMLEKYRDAGAWKPYLIFGLADETFSILCAKTSPVGVPPRLFYFYCTLFNQIYWVTGCVIGSIFSAVVTLPTKGLDFVLTALFLVIFIDQWRQTNRRLSAITGVVASAVCLFLFGPDHFLLPSMGVILVVLSVLKKTKKGAETS